MSSIKRRRLRVINRLVIGVPYLNLRLQNESFYVKISYLGIK